MSNIDDRVVKLEFDNSTFESNVASTIDSLDKLNETLQLKGAGQGFDSISAAANGVNLSGMADAVDTIASKFDAMGAIGFAALQRLTNGVLGFIHRAGGDILSPILSGGRKRAQNLEQAKFAFEGLGVDVTGAMDDALKAVKGTSFGLDEAAQAAGVFAGAGIKLGDQMQHALRGVTGTAAITGRSFKEISDIFTSSAGTGVVNNQDLQQFATRGLNAAAAVAKVMGTTEAHIHDLAGSGKLDFKTFADAMDKAFGAHATDANKTYAGSLANVHAAMSRLGASFFTGELTQQRDLFNTLGPAIDRISEALQPLIQAFLGLSDLVHKRAITIIDVQQFRSLEKFRFAIAIVADVVRLAFVEIALVVGRVKDAFRDIFPKADAGILITIAQTFKNLFTVLVPSAKTLNQFARIFDGFFSIISIGWTIIKNLWNVLLDLESVFIHLGRGNVLEFFAKIGDFFTNLQRDLVEGHAITAFFMKLEAAILSLSPKVEKIRQAIAGFFHSFDLHGLIGQAGGVDVQVGRITERFHDLVSIMKGIGKVFEPFIFALKAVGAVIAGVWFVIKDFFTGLAKKLSADLNNQDYSHLWDAFNTALLGGFFAVILNFIRGSKGQGSGLFASIEGTFRQLTSTLQSMQTKIKAEALMKIAESIGILTASVLVLSLIDSVSLTKALTAMATGFGELMATFAVLTNIEMKNGPAKFLAITTGINMLATALLIMAGAMAIFGHMKSDALARGIGGMTAAIALLVTTAIVLSKSADNMFLAAAGITEVAGAMILMGVAMKIFGSMSWGEIAKGLVAMAAGLVTMGAVLSSIGPSAIIAAPALLVTSAALILFGSAMKILGSMSWGEIGKGLTVLLGGLVIIGAVLSSIGPTAILAAPALLITADALVILAAVMKIFGSMKWSEIGKGLTALGGALIIIGATISAMSGALVGAVSLVIAAVAIASLAESIKQFAGIKTGDLVKALIGLAAALTVIGVAAYLLFTTGATIAIIALAYALVFLGAGIALIGAGIFLISEGFAALATTGRDGARAFVGALIIIAKALPALGADFGTFAVTFVKNFLADFPSVIKVLADIMAQILDTFIKIVPRLYHLGLIFVTWIVKGIRTKAKDVIDAGIFLLETLLQAILDNIENITNTVALIIVKFMDALRANMPALTLAGEGLIISLVNGITGQVQPITDAVARLIITFIGALQGSALSILFAGVALVISVLDGIALAVPLIAASVTNIIVAFIKAMQDSELSILFAAVNLVLNIVAGIRQSQQALITAGVATVISFIRGIGQNALILADAAAGVIIDFLNGLADVIRRRNADIRAAGKNIAGAIIDGLTGGLLDTVSLNRIGSAFISVAQKGYNAFTGFFHLKSPSRLMMEAGNNIAAGLAIGIGRDTSVVAAANDMSTRLHAALTNAVAIIGQTDQFNPTITPVLDLTQVQSDADKIAGFIQNGTKLSPTLSTDQARLISADTNQKQDTPPVSAGPTQVNFEQTINAPTQLSPSDIYKQTRNQITMAKEELNIP